MKLDSSLLSMISSFMEVAFILFFVLIALGLLIAARVGYKRGIYKSTYKLLGLVMFIVLAIVTAKPFMDLIMNFDISAFFGGNINLNLDLGEKAINIDVAPTTVEATLFDFVSSFCGQIDASKYVGDVTQFAKTFVISIVSIILYIVDLILIFVIGNAILGFFWLTIFRKAAPKITQKLGKVKFVGMIETIVSYVIVMFLVLSPFTSLVNSINQGVQKSKARESENEMVQEVVQLVDIYNDSLFANVFFNWNTALNKENLTFDTYIMDYFATTANGGIDTISLNKDLEKLITAVGDIASNLGKANEDGLPTISDVSVLDEMVGSVFSVLTSSDYITGLVELSVKLALDSDLLEGIISNWQYFNHVDLDNISFTDDIDAISSMCSDIIGCGIIEEFIDLNTLSIKADVDLISYLDDLFTNPDNSEKVDKVFSAFDRIDDLSILNAAIQSLGYWGVANDSSYTVLKMLGGDTEMADPYADVENREIVQDFISEFRLGEEIHMLLDACWGLASCGDHVIKNAYLAFTSEDEAVKESARNDLVATLSANEATDAFRDAITGYSHMKEDGTPKERDASKGEHYAILDSRIITKIINSSPFAKDAMSIFGEKLSEIYGDAFPEAQSRWNTLMDSVYSTSATTTPIKFFKGEIESVLKVVTNVIKMKVPSSSSTPSTAPFMAHPFNEDPDPSEDPEKPFEYKDYDSFLAALVNSFDGWINPNDIPGSLLSVDSRFAPYIAELFKCLKPLDDSKIAYALGVPFLSSKILSIKESTQDFFDVQICVDQINASDHIFADISNFFDANLVTILQRFCSGFLMNDEGTFDVSSIGADINGFLNKFNSYLTLVKDDPSTTADETVIDTHPLKYYFAEVLKKFYNFEIFNPTTGENANKNFESLFNYVFGLLESFGVEAPSATLYEKLDSKAKWEAELTAITDLFAIIGQNNLLNIADYSSNLNSALLYSLAGDITSAETYADYNPDMPKNLGEVISCVGDSVLFSDLMGGLLDTYLTGTICDPEIGVKFGNIHEGTYWHQEGENMNKLLTSIAKLDLDLENLDFTKITDVIGLNDMLHALSDSLIFNDSGTNRFGQWLYAKVDTAMNSMSGGLLADPGTEDWNTDWDTTLNTIDNTAYPNNKIAYYDFIVRDGALPTDYDANKEGWSCSDYATHMDAFKTSVNYSTLSSEEVKDLYKTPGFMDDYYNDVLQYDEVGRLVNVLANGMKIMDGGSGIDFASLNVENLDNILTAINNTNCLRIASYNAMMLAKSGIGTNEFVDFNQASFDYLITTGEDIDDYSTARANRQIEFDHIIDFYDYYKQLQDIAGETLDTSSFFEKDKMMDILGVDANGNPDPSKTDILTNMLAELESTSCFNLHKVRNRTGSELSLFETMMVSLMEQSGLKELADIPTSDTTTMEQRVMKISDCEVDATINDSGYNSSWVERNGAGEIIGGECASITDVLKSVVGVTTGTSIDADELSVTTISASNVSKVMKSVNGSYLCTGVMQHFVRTAFTGGLGLETMLKFNSTDADMVANFNLNYSDFGGADNSCGEGTEIYTFQKVLESMQFENGSGEFEFISLNNLQDSLQKKPDCFDGIFYFLYNSKTLGAAYPGNTNIKGRDVLLYNSLASFDSYLIGSDKENKMLSIGKLFETTEAISDDYYKVEANGIARIIDAAGNSISGISVDNLRSDSTTKNMILNTIRYTYDRNDGNTTFTTDTNITLGRAYFASEIISGIFDDVLENEYSTIAANYSTSELGNIADYQKFYFASKAGGGRAITANDITTNVFDNLNAVELNGLDGMISMTEFINGDADRTGASVADIATNPFVVAMTSNSSIIRNLFKYKLHTGDQDSRMAKVLFISRGAKTVEKETTLADDINPANSGLLVLLKYVSNMPDSLLLGPSSYTWTTGFTNDYYGTGFGFDTYGDALLDYVDSCVPSI